MIMRTFQKYTCLPLIATLAILSGCATEHLPPQAVPEVEQSEIKPDQKNIALMVPLTGAHQRLGKALQQASQLALEEKKPDAFELITIDTDSQTRISPAALSQLAQRMPEAIIGPVFAKHAQEVASVSRAPILTFSNDTTLEGKRDLYRMGLAPGALAVRAITYAKDQGYKDIYALIPKGKYGTVLDKALSLHQGAKQYNLQKVLYYNDITAAVTKLRKEAVPKLEDLERTPTNGRSSAVLIAYEDPNQFRQILSTWRSLAEEDDARVKFIGIGQWDGLSPQDMEMLEGALVADLPHNELAQFEVRFQQKFGYKPPRLAVLAYDATLLATSALQHGHNISRDLLHSHNGFRGTTGIFRFDVDGSSDRGLAVYEYNSGQWQEVEAAPTKF